MSEEKTYYTPDGEALSQDEWWDRRWHIVVTPDGLKAMPHEDALKAIPNDIPFSDQIIFGVTLYNQSEAEKMIKSIEAYIAHLRQQ